MNILQKTIGAIATFLIDKADYNTVIQAYYKGKNSGKGIDWKRQPQNMSAKEIKDWRFALMAATDPENPRRGDLMRFYQNLMTDLHLSACIENRILPVQCAPFKLVDNKGDEDIDAKKLLEKPWYIELVRLVTNHTFEGTKLIEMYELNDKGELKEISEIPQSNFIPTKGIVIREEYDSKGVSYKEGVYKNYYVQIGNDYNLGLLNRVAVIVIAKKLGLGSWMSYIDRFGVPPLFAITNRMDTTRRDELFEMLEAFRMNHFAVLQGDEKIEIPQGYNVDAHQTFKSLIDDVANKEISKYINGGTGTTDEKAFVGSAEVHERLLHLRNSVDKLMFKFYFNEEIKPRLVKLSPVYAPLDKLTLEWDESENLSVKDIINAVVSLSAYYEFDIEELVRMTGLPFTELKRMGLMLPGSMSQGVDEQKKKNEAKITSFGPVADKTHPEALDKKWLGDIERIAEGLHNGSINPSDLDNKMVLKLYDTFNEAANISYGKSYYQDTSGRKMREHLLKFSGAKTFRLLSDINAEKKSGTSIGDFTERAKNISGRQLGAWLKTEIKDAKSAAQMAIKWKQFEEEKDIYPNLMNVTMMDDKVRDPHAANHGIIKPVEAWVFIPPYDHRCRCKLIQTKDPFTPNRELKNINEAFKTNPGLTGEVYTEEHNYFKGMSKDVKMKTRDILETLKPKIPYTHSMKVGDKKVFIHDFHDAKDYKNNLDAAKKICHGLKVDIYIRPHRETHNKKNPEFAIGKEDILGDLKKYDIKSKSKAYNFIKNSLEAASDQEVSHVVMDISEIEEPKEQIMSSIMRRLYGSFSADYYKSITNVIIINKDKVVEINRKKALDKDFSSIERLFD